MRGSFSDAATALDFTQPAVSQHISRLETALGVRVLERNARGVSLTPAGEVLVRHASALLEAARRAEEAVRDAAGVGRAQVRVAAFPSAAAGLLPGATRDLRGRRPDAELALQVLELEGALDALLAGRVDVAVIVDSELSPAKRRAGVDYLPICDDEMRDRRGRGPPAGDAHVGRAGGAQRRAVPDHRGRGHVRGLQRRAARVLRRGLRADGRVRVGGLPGAAGHGGLRHRRRDDPDDGAHQLPQRRRRPSAARPRAVAADPRRGAQGRAATRSPST